MSKVGFLGLGQMGLPMARNLVKAGKNLVVFDVTDAPLSVMKDDGASIASTPKELAEQCETIITMLPTSTHVNAVYSEQDGILEGLQPNSLCIDSSTIDPFSAQNLAKSIEKIDQCHFMDAPVSGGVPGATAGTLTFMVGGSAESLAKAQPYFDIMGSKAAHCGDVGTGQIAKISNNLMLAISMIGTSEAMNLGIKLGMDPKVLAEIFNASSGQSWVSTKYNPVPGVMDSPASRGYTGGFGTSLMHKDVSLAIDAAKNIGAPLPLGSNAWSIYSLLKKQGHGNKDFSVIYDWLQDSTEKQKP